MEYCWDIFFEEYIKTKRPDLYDDFTTTRNYVKAGMIYSLSVAGFYNHGFSLFLKQKNKTLRQLTGILRAL